MVHWQPPGQNAAQLKIYLSLDRSCQSIYQFIILYCISARQNECLFNYVKVDSYLAQDQDTVLSI